MCYNRQYPEFSWSSHRSNVLEDCPRRYFYNYYASHRGWAQGASEESSAAYRLSKAMSLPVALSEGVEKAIKMFAENPSGIHEKDFYDVLKSKLHEICISSTNTKEWKANPKENIMLTEMLNFDGGFRSEAFKEMAARVKGRLAPVATNFFQTSTAKEIIGGAKILECYSSFNQFGFFKMKGARKNGASEEIMVWGRADVIHAANGKTIATIWQTGEAQESKAEAEKLRMQVIAIYVAKHYSIAFENIVVRRCNLLNGTETNLQVSADEYKDILRTIGQKISQMAALVEEEDLMMNKPLGKERFSKKDGSKCDRCEFCQLCQAQSVPAAS